VPIRKKRLIGLAVALAAAAAGGYGYLEFWRAEHAAPAEIVLYGNIDIREADLGFNVPGRVETMRVEEGDEVGKGELLATLEPEIYDAEVEAAKAQMAAQRAILDRLLAGSRPEEIKEAREDARAFEAQLELARESLERVQQAVTSGAVSQQELDKATSQVKDLEALLNAAEQRLSLAILGPRKEDIAAARAQLHAREAELTLALRRLDYVKLFAKDRGVIKTRIVEPGAVVLANTPVYTMALINPVWVRTYISEPDLGRIQPGMKAEVFTDSAPGTTYHGWIGFISPVAEFTPKTVETPELRTSLVYRLRVYVNNPDNSLRQGQPVTVKLLTDDNGREQDGAPRAGATGEPAP
jgi:HlyD family secretion protein